MFSNDHRGSEHCDQTFDSMNVCAERETEISIRRSYTHVEGKGDQQHNLPGRFLHDCRRREGGCGVKWRTNQNGRLLRSNRAQEKL